jgi:imidazolonepropionase
MHQRWDQLWTNGRLVTADAGPGAWGLVEAGAVAFHEGRIAYVGPEAELPGAPQELATAVEDLDGALVTPGLIDSHTHLVWAGSRADEFERRLAGESYADIARSGGGIASTVRATRAASEEELLTWAAARAGLLAAEGVTTVEIKSGYGLDLATERKMLRVARRLGEDPGLTVVTTYLGLHALPADYAGRQDEYVDRVCFEDLPALAHEGLVDAVDAFCEGIAFTPRQVDRFFRAARTLGLPVKLHAEQLSNLGGAELAASHGALSADHLEYLDRHGSEAMARAGTVAVLLPGAFYTLRERQVPPIALLRDAGVRMAVATDANPGSSPLLSLLTAGNMACVLFGLTPAEAFLGMTAIAAEALGLRDRGRLRVGMRADCCVWRVDQPAALVYEIATHRPWRIVVAGRPVDNAARSL